MQRYPLPVKKNAKKEEKKKDAIPEPKIPDNETIKSALDKAVSWSNTGKIASKFSVGTLTTAKYQERVVVFDNMNVKVV
jgi:hypothetical protein